VGRWGRGVVVERKCSNYGRI
jgi:hypothetical protein